MVSEKLFHSIANDTLDTLQEKIEVSIMLLENFTPIVAELVH